MVAAGDCTVLPHPLTGEGRVRLESVHGAVHQASVAAATLVGAGGRDPLGALVLVEPGQLRLQIAGLSTGFDSFVVRGDMDEEKFSVLYYRDGELLAVDAVNNPVDYMVVRKALTQGVVHPGGAGGRQLDPAEGDAGGRRRRNRHAQPTGPFRVAPLTIRCVAARHNFRPCERRVIYVYARDHAANTWRTRAFTADNEHGKQPHCRL